jgi:hypothetical protein
MATGLLNPDEPAFLLQKDLGVGDRDGNFWSTMAPNSRSTAQFALPPR